MTPRRAFAALALAAVVATRIEPAYLGMLFGDRDARTRAFVPIIDARWPQYAGFIEGVRAHTAPGDTIAIVTPDSEPREAYPFAYYRASYYLAGREVLPVIDPQGGAPIPQNRAAARYIAVFGEAPVAGELVWKGESGALYRK
jgi:hypothetical protein